MDYSSLITNDIFLKLKCDGCKDYLSYFPIFISEEKKNICGRCYNPTSEKNYSPNEVYEALAQLVQFPCRYKEQGCPVNTIPKDMPDHEKMCDFRIVKCPVQDCIWKGARPIVLFHCQSQHADIMLKNGEFELDVSKSHQCNLMEDDSALFVVKQKIYPINKLMELSVYYPEYEVNVKEISCEISFKTTSRCLIIKYSINAFDKNDTVEVILDCLKDENNSSASVIGKINFENAVGCKVPPIEVKIDEDLLHPLKCFHCGEYCLPPIYNKGGDYAVQCADCKTKTDLNLVNGKNSTSEFMSIFGAQPSPPNRSIIKAKPPSFSFKNTTSLGASSSNFSGSGSLCVPQNEPPNISKLSNETRNINLENIARLLNYPCQNKKSGCPFISKPPEMKSHLRFCLYGRHTCPLAGNIKCNWTGRGMDVRTHIINDHNNIILKSSTVSEDIATPTAITACPISRCYVILFSNHLLRLNFIEVGQCYQWHMQIIGPFESGYMFELEIIDRNKMGRNWVSKHPCIALAKDNSELVANNGCSFYKDQVKNLISDQMITFKVQVLKQPSLI